MPLLFLFSQSHARLWLFACRRAHMLPRRYHPFAGSHSSAGSGIFYVTGTHTCGEQVAHRRFFFNFFVCARVFSGYLFCQRLPLSKEVDCFITIDFFYSIKQEKFNSSKNRLLLRRPVSHTGMYLSVLLFHHDIVPPLAFGDEFILDCLGRAAADACHAMGTVPFPYRFPIHHVNVVHRALLGALAAGDTGV